MAVSATYPGVYVQEVPSGVRTIAGVSTSTTLFVGAAADGPIQVPVLCVSYTEFKDTFGESGAAGDLARYVRLFFLNGGTRCYVLRIANGATTSSVTLNAEDGTPALELTAKSAGLTGESIRAAVSYKGQYPEITFNIDIFRVDAKGAVSASESFIGLSMDPNSATYAPELLSQRSDLVNATFPGGGTPTAISGTSRSGRPVSHDSGAAAGAADAFDTVWGALLPATAATGTDNFQISVDGSPFVRVDLGAVTAADAAAVESAFANAIAAALGAGSGTTVSVALDAGPAPAGGTSFDVTRVLTIRSNNGGNVLVRPGGANDISAALMLGTPRGGIETGAYAAIRPAPSGVTLGPTLAGLSALGTLLQNAVTTLNLGSTPLDVSAAFARSATPATARVWMSDDTAAAHQGSDGVRQTLAGIRDAINAAQAASPKTFLWKAELWGSRLAILPTAGDANTAATGFSTAPNDLAALFSENVRWYSLGASGTGAFQTAGTTGDDGAPPEPSDYADAYLTADEAVDSFNLLVLPPSVGVSYAHESLYADASVFCQKRRAFLLADSPIDWATTSDVVNGVDDLRIGMVNDHAAVYYPRLILNEGGLRRKVGPSGAMAGLYARIDANRGVWKAPAGTEATLRGIVGVTHQITDAQNGVINPEGVNAIRVLPNGIVSWGARTLDGADAFGSEYKYVPIRRLALYLEESLYRGLAWTVFEPNDEPLWAQIRLNVGAFMHNLFRQGAFQGKTPQEAYFVKCDTETTTQSDRNVGMVNVWVGFAPLKPAEFVVLYLQQMAGQLQT